MTNRQHVLEACPTAILVIDTTPKEELKCDWAIESVYAVGYFITDAPLQSRILRIRYDQIVKCTNWTFLSGWRNTSDRAWKTAWKNIEVDVLRKFEE